jgi:hypothetical protein
MYTDFPTEQYVSLITVFSIAFSAWKLFVSHKWYVSVPLVVGVSLMQLILHLLYSMAAYDAYMNSLLQYVVAAILYVGVYSWVCVGICILFPIRWLFCYAVFQDVCGDFLNAVLVCTPIVDWWLSLLIIIARTALWMFANKRVAWADRKRMEAAVKEVHNNDEKV